MTNWRAVIIGFVLILGLGTVGLVLPGLGQFFAALIGGFVAGYLGGNDLLSGFWHGILAGALGSLLLAAVLWIAVSIVGFTLGPVAGTVSSLIGLGAVIIVAIVAFITAIESGVAGAVGAVVRG